jgi:hypothetical protein
MNILAEKVLKVTVEFIGPASLRFLERQTVTHLNNLAFAALERKHIPDLLKWIKISGGLLIGEAKAAELCKKIDAI